MLKVASADPDVSHWLASTQVTEKQHDNAFEWLKKSIRIGMRTVPGSNATPAGSRYATIRAFFEISCNQCMQFFRVARLIQTK
ncbi:MAG: hypothetical protein OEM82_11225, partial [Acidobacteriota bacterium]|nr:hypothetical protein [Acidobacteriota bacterium]